MYKTMMALLYGCHSYNKIKKNDRQLYLNNFADILRRKGFSKKVYSRKEQL